MATEKAKRKSPGPRSFYLIYSVVDGELVNHCFSRKTDEVLTALGDHDGAKVMKLVAPPGR